MGWHLVLLLAPVVVDHFSCVDGKALVGVDRDTEQARVGVDEPSGVA